MSRTGLSPADIAESFRDRCGDGSVEWVYTPTQTWVLLDVADMLDENDKLREQLESVVGRSFRTADKMTCLEAENAKLRELVRELSWFADYACDLLPSCNRCPMLGDGMPCNLEKALNRMSELGVGL